MLSKKLKSKQGITLPVAMAVTCVLIILSVSLIGIALTSITNTSSTVNSRQAYLNARSALEYAYTYYCNTDSVPDITTVSDEYMVMLDKDGGTVEGGADFVATEADAQDYTTYVQANYIPSTTGDSLLKLVAYSRSTDAFGKKSKSVSIAGTYTLNKKTSKSRMTLTDVDMTTDVLNYPQQDAINMHVKQYPGENWTPFYYLWTYKDVTGLYSLTDNCYGLETYYKNNNNLYNSSRNVLGPYTYYTLDSSGNIVKSSKTIYDAFTENHDNSDPNNPHVFSPEPWNVIESNPDDPRNGPATSFASSGSGGWYNATYYYDSDNVNYFNLIITKKGQVLNGRNGEWRPETQTSEMFHLWYLFSDDKNIYFEFLQPGLLYKDGYAWNGLETLDDRMLVYVKNKKTTVHFKVKGLGDPDDPDEANNAPTKAPVINSITVNGVSIFDTTQRDTNIRRFNNGNVDEDMFSNSTLESIWQLDFVSTIKAGSAGRGNGSLDYFYGIDDAGKQKMLYEGCGWWVANIECAKNFDMVLTYYDKSGNPVTETVSVTPNTENEAFVVVDPARPNSIACRLTERKACDLIGLDYKAYTTVRVKSSMIGSAVAPYLDYESSGVSTTAKRILTEKVNEARSSYLRDDYEDASYDALQNVLNEAVDLLNDTVVHGDDVYEKKVQEIDDAVKALRTKVVSNELYSEYEKLVNECTSIITEQHNKVVYDVVQFALFEMGEYVNAKALIDSGEILNSPSGKVYNSSEVIELIDKLKAEYTSVVSSKLDKSVLDDAIKKAQPYLNNDRYKREYRDALAAALTVAENADNLGPTQSDIDKAAEDLNKAIEDVLANPDVNVDTRPLVDLVALAQPMIDLKVDCTDETYKNLQDAVNEANSMITDISATQEKVDAVYDKLKKAYDEFYVYKPGSGTTNGDSTATDKLLSENKVRIWVEGLAVGTVLRTYHEGSINGAEKTAETPYEVTGLTMQLYKDDTVVGNYNVGSSFNKIVAQGLSYTDVDYDSFNSARFVLTTVQNELGEIDPSTGKHQIIGTKTVVFTTEQNVPVSEMQDGNIVFDLAGLVVTSQGNAEKDILEMKRAKLSELYISGAENAVVEVTGADGEKTDYNTIKEGPYNVARYVYEAGQNVQVRYYSIDDSEYLYTNSFASQIGQYVLKPDETNKTDRPTVKINIPYNSTTISGDDTTFVGIKIGNSEPVEAYFDGMQYVYTAQYSGEFAFSVYRRYGDDGEQEIVTSSMNVPRAGELNVTYVSDNQISAAYSAYTFKNVSSELISAKNIYPKYSTNVSTGSNVSFNSVGELSGVVSSTFASELLTAPAAVSAPVPVVTAANGFTTKTVTFDYFNQDGLGGIPRINLGKTVIWIDADRTLNGAQPWVYVWDRYDRSLNGAWPGTQAIRVDESDDCYYVVVSATAYGCIITKNAGAEKVGGTPAGQANDGQNDGGQIYLDMADTQCFEDTHPCSYPTNWDKSCLSNRASAPLVHDSFCRPFECNYGNENQTGGCCLFTLIDDEVLSRNGYTDYRSSSTVTTVMGGAEVVGGVYIYDYHASTGNKCPDRAGHRVSIWPYAPGKVTNYSYGTSVGGAYAYHYRAKRSDVAPSYTTMVPAIDRGTMVTDLRMPYVGGSKIKLTNMSYNSSYGCFYLNGNRELLPDSAFKSENGAWVLGTNLFGGSGGNRESMGRVGDTTMTLIFDWYERKIPVDQSDEYSFQIQGLRRSSVTPGKNWYDDGYATDSTFTQQIQDVYGNVWLVMKDITVRNSVFTNMSLCTIDPETVQVEDNQTIYFKKLPNLQSVSIQANGVGAGGQYLMTDDTETTTYLCATIPAQTPFITFSAYFDDGTMKVYRTSLQGDDLILFDTNMNSGAGGWDNYVPPKVALERALYGAHSLYYGKVLAIQYDAKGNPKNLGGNGGRGSYKYAGAIKKNLIDPYFTDGVINSNGYSANINDVNRWVSAYSDLYVAMSNARAYVPGHNYPEYLRNGQPDIFDSTAVAEIERLLLQAENLYESDTTTVNDIVRQTDKLNSAVDNITISTDDRIPIIFFDTKKAATRGAEFALRYKLDESGMTRESTVEYKNTEGCPIIFVQPAAGENYLYDLQFVIRYPDGTTKECALKDKIDLLDGAWVFVHQPGDGATTPDTSYWVQNTATDYRQISASVLQQTSASDAYLFDMAAVRASVSSAIPVANTEAEAKGLKYKPITLYFKYDVTVNTYDPSNSYKIKAGAYTFDENFINTQAEINSGQVGPFIYTDTGGSNWKPRLNLYSTVAKNFFEDPINYGEYVAPLDGDPSDIVDATALSGWVTKSGSDLTITAGAHATNKTVNLTVNDGAFAENRLMKYMTTGKMYFRWEGNTNLNVYNNVTFNADELTFALSGKLVGTSNYGKHFQIGTYDDDDKMDVIFQTDMNIEYYDSYGDLHQFTIREGAYEITRPAGQTGYIADLFDEEYWESMEYVTIKNRYDNDGGLAGTSGDRFKPEVVYSNS